MIGRGGKEEARFGCLNVERVKSAWMEKNGEMGMVDDLDTRERKRVENMKDKMEEVECEMENL